MKLIFLGNAYWDKETHGGFAGDVFAKTGVCPTLLTMSGGGRMPHTIVTIKKNKKSGVTVYRKHINRQKSMRICVRYQRNSTDDMCMYAWVCDIPHIID